MRDDFFELLFALDAKILVHLSADQLVRSTSRK